MARTAKQAAGSARRSSAQADAPPVADAGPSARRAEVLALAADLFARDGYATTTVRDIADAAAIRSGSLYHHFVSKEAMVDEILRAFLDEISTAYDAIADARLPPSEAVRALMEASFDALDRHRAAVVIYENDGGRLAALDRFGYLAAAERRLERVWSDVVARGVESGEFRRLDPTLSGRFVGGTLWTAARWYRPGGEHAPLQIADAYASMLLGGIAKPAKKKSKKKS